MQVTDAVADVLAAADDGLTERDVMRRLRDAGHAKVSRSAVTRALGASARFRAEDVLGRTVWHLTDGDPPVDAALPDATTGSTTGATTGAAGSGPLAGLDLRDWQVEAFARWAAAGCAGVVEAITGAGKTRLAVAAVRAVRHHAGRTLVLVPTLDLQEQWVRELRRHLDGARIGRLGGGHDDDLHSHEVVVATVQSAAAAPLDLPYGTRGLLVADEAHRYGAPTWGAALGDEFDMRLALTATYERNDDGLVEVLGPYFGGVVARYSYVEAARDGVIAPFRVALVGTDLDRAEREVYDQLDARTRQFRRELVGHGYPKAPLDLIARAAAVVAAAPPPGSGPPSRELAAARGYLSSLRGRRDVAAQAAGKLEVVRVVAPALVDRRSLVFTDTVEQAELATKLLAREGVEAEEVHGGLDDTKRAIRMAQFRNGNLSCVVAPRVLDEGVDVPEAEVAVVLAAFRTRRQMVQRLGRVLRVKPDGREARLVIAYAKDTREDPANGAHEDFLSEVTDVAREVVTLDADASPDAVAAWLGDAAG